MAFKRPRLKEIDSRVWADLSSLAKSGIPKLSLVGLLGKALTGCSHMLHGHIQFNDGAMMPDTRIDRFIYRWAEIMGIARKGGDQAKGIVTIRGAKGVLVPKGTELVHLANGTSYKTVETITILDEPSLARIVCVEIGTKGNLAPGAELYLTATIAGIESAIVEGKGLVGGSDPETLASLQRRYLFKLRNPAVGGDDSDYLNTALENLHVTRAWVFPSFAGSGTVGVSFLFDDLDKPGQPIPDRNGPEYKAVESHIQTHCPASARSGLAIFPPKPLWIKIRAKIMVDGGSLVEKATIEKRLKRLFREQAQVAGAKVPGTASQTFSGTIYLSRILNIFATSGVSDYKLIWPTGNITPETYQILILTGVDWVE